MAIIALNEKTVTAKHRPPRKTAVGSTELGVCTSLAGDDNRAINDNISVRHSVLNTENRPATRMHPAQSQHRLLRPNRPALIAGDATSRV